MLANKALLSGALFATFVSGTFVGYAAHGAGRSAGVPPTDPDAIYAPQLDRLKAKGYDDAEMAEARKAYEVYFNGYQQWWGAFLDAARPNTDKLDAKLEKSLEDLERRRRARLDGK